MWTSLEAQKLKDVIWIHVRKDLAKSCNFPHKVATFYIMGQFGADWGDGAPGRGRLNTFWVFYGLKTFPIWMLKVPACQTVCPVLGGWSRDWVPILWLRRGCRGLPGGLMLQTIPSNCVTLHPLCGTASKQNENLYAAFAKFKFSLWAKQTIQTIKWCETSFLQCAEWDFLIFLSRESIFCNIALRSLCLTWSDLRTPRGSGLTVRTSRSLRNTRASSWISTLWRKMMNAEFWRKTLCQVNASKVSYKYNFCPCFLLSPSSAQ